MRHQSILTPDWQAEDRALPVSPDSETLALLRGFLRPILEDATSWQDLRARLANKGYRVAFRSGHLALVNAESDKAICTGSMLGVPLRDIAQRIGRPAIKAHADGMSGDLA